MAKRIPLSERRANDARGVEVLFRSAEENAETQQSIAGEPENGVSAKTVLAKVTIYIRPEQVVAIESIQLAQRQQTGQKPDKSALLQEAVDLLIAKYQI